MFQFPGSVFLTLCIQIMIHTITYPGGFPHSEIFGSKLTYSSPKHIGFVSPVLHRLLVSRHPPCALSNLTKLKIKKYELHCYLVFKEHTFIYREIRLPLKTEQNVNTETYIDEQRSSILHRKEVIQPHLPIRLPCYDFTPIICPTLGGWLQKGYPTDFGCYKLSWCDGRCVQGPGTYSPRHADPRLLAIPASCRRVAAYNPN